MGLWFLSHRSLKLCLNFSAKFSLCIVEIGWILWPVLSSLFHSLSSPLYYGAYPVRFFLMLHIFHFYNFIWFLFFISSLLCWDFLSCHLFQDNLPLNLETVNDGGLKILSDNPNIWFIQCLHQLIAFTHSSCDVFFLGITGDFVFMAYWKFCLSC